MAINLYTKFTSFEITDDSLQKSGLDWQISSHKRPLVSEVTWAAGLKKERVWRNNNPGRRYGPIPERCRNVLLFLFFPSAA